MWQEHISIYPRYDIHGVRRLQEPLGFLPSCHERAAPFKTKPFDGQTRSTFSTSGTCGSFFANPYSPLVKHCAKEWRRPPDPARQTTALTHKICSVPFASAWWQWAWCSWMNRISQDQFQNVQTVVVLSYDLGHAPVHMEEVIASVSWREKLLQCASRFKRNTNNHTRTTRKACRKWDFFNPFEQILPAGPVMHNHCKETIELHLHDIRLQKISLLYYYYPGWVCQIVVICCSTTNMLCVADQFPAYLQNASVLHQNKAYANWATAQNSASAMCPPPGRHCNRLGLCHHCGHWCVAIWRTCQQIGVSPRCNFASPP